MKTFLITLILLVGYSAVGQRYFEITLDSASLSDSCSVDLKVKKTNLTNMCQFVVDDWTLGKNLGYSSTLSNVCKGSNILVTIMDSNCTYLLNLIHIDTNSADQISLDTIIAVMPSASGACDGSLSFHFNNVSPVHERAFGVTSAVSPTTDSVFTGLCEGVYSYGVKHPSHPSSDYYIQIDLNLGVISPCYAFDIDVEMKPSHLPTTSGCDGSLTATPNVGTIPDYSFYFSNYCCAVGGGYGVDSASFLCQGPYKIRIESFISAYYYMGRTFYVDTLLPDSSWGGPPVVIPGTDTILIPSIFNCSFNYSIPFDTVYLDQFEYTGGGVYEFMVFIVQDTDTIILNESAIIDTNNNFFIDVTVYCDDSTLSTRSGSPLQGASRNYVYFGDQTLSIFEQGQVSEQNEIVLYPNPAQQIFNINSSTLNFKDFEIYDLNGRILYSQLCNNKILSIDISGLTPSVYFIKYTDEFGYSGFSRFVKM
jgi:hypothetical protein